MYIDLYLCIYNICTHMPMCSEATDKFIPLRIRLQSGRQLQVRLLVQPDDRAAATSRVI